MADVSTCLLTSHAYAVMFPTHQSIAACSDMRCLSCRVPGPLRMTEDDHQGALNSGETAGCAPLAAGELAENLRKLMLSMYAENISPDGKVRTSGRRAVICCPQLNRDIRVVVLVVIGVVWAFQ